MTRLSFLVFACAVALALTPTAAAEDLWVPGAQAGEGACIAMATNGDFSIRLANCLPSGVNGEKA